MWLMREINHFLGDNTLNLLHEIASVADIELRDEDGNVCENFENAAEITIESRRMMRDETKRIQELNRKRRYETNNPTRHRRKHDANTTPINQKSEIRNQKSYIKKEEYKNTPLQVVYPDWLPDVLWTDYLEHRKKLRKPMTERAKELAINKLRELKELGNDPQEVLQQSIVNGWQGLFEIKRQGVQRQAEGDVSERTKRILRRGL